MASVARPAQEADRRAICTTLSRAFAGDPGRGFLFLHPAQRQRKLPLLFDLLLTANLPLGGCDATTNCEVASMWRPPRQGGISLWDLLRHLGSFLKVYGFGGARRAFSLLGAMDQHHPTEPHWYLMVIGTDPAQQGKGFGGVALRHRLAQVDAAHMPAYLEASKWDNVPIYQNFGFEQRGELQVPNGPVIYPMW